MAIPLIYSTAAMLAAIQMEQRPTSFLRDRYFPTNPDTDIFDSHEVLMDIRQGNRRMAPVVLPRKKGIVVTRDAYRTERMEPPLVAPVRTLTLDDLQMRGFGEALYSNLTAQQRAARILGNDLSELDDMITRREEFIAARCMMDNGYILPQYADEWGTQEYIPYEIHFYEGAANPNVFTPAVPWNQDGATVYADLGVMVRMLTAASLTAADFIGSADLIDAILMNDEIYKLMDNRNINIGNFDPAEWPEGAGFYGRLNIAGRMINLISYEQEYEDDITHAVTPLFASGEGVLTAPGAGRGLYGAVVQIEESDHEFHQYAGTRVPKFATNVVNDDRSLRLASKPLFVPRNVGPWVSIRAFQ